MDILDIDEELKDDSFMFLEDKTHDDVSNILQQWKSNNDLLKANKFDSKTFTRCKKKLNQEIHDTHNMTFDVSHYPSLPKYNIGSFVYSDPQNFQTEINGLASSMHKSFLQDTSPPLSICSSIDKSIDVQHAMLLHYTQNIKDDDEQNIDETFTANNYISNGNIANNILHKQEMEVMAVISRDETQFKDSQIGQFDEISLALSKTESNCSTMNNSIENMVDILKQDGAVTNIVRDSILDKEMIINTSLNLVENSLYESAQIQEWDTPEEKKNDCPIYKSTPFTKKTSKQIFCNASISPIGPKYGDYPAQPQLTSDESNLRHPLDALTLVENQQSNRNNSSYDDLNIKLPNEKIQLNNNLLFDKGNEEDFEHFLNEFSKVELSSEQQRLKTSVDIIKNHYKQNSSTSANNETLLKRDFKCPNNLTFNSSFNKDLLPAQDGTQVTKKTEVISPSFTLNDGERLLSRRSRLYDDENISPEFVVQPKQTNFTSMGSMPYKEVDSSITRNDNNEIMNDMTNATTTGSMLYDRRKRDQNFYSTAMDKKIPTMKYNERYSLATTQSSLLTNLKQKDSLAMDKVSLEKRVVNPTYLSNNLNQNTKYLTFVKPKHKDIQQIREPFAPSDELTQTYIASPHDSTFTNPSSSSLTINNLKCNSNRVLNENNVDSAISSESEDYQHFREISPTKCNSVQSVVSNDEQYEPELKSPLYTKAKSFHNLTRNIDMDMDNNKASNAISDISLIPTTSQLRKPNCTFLASKQQSAIKTHEFKIPKALPPMRTLKSTSGGENKRSLVARPSSGYYSLSSTSNNKSNNRLAPKDSSKDVTANVPRQSTEQNANSGSKASSLPSGIRPPSSIKRSALPRPSSLVRR